MSQHISKRPGSAPAATRLLTLTIALTLGASLGAVALSASPAVATAAPASRDAAATAVQAEDDEVVLPLRVAVAISRTQRALDRSEAAIDDHRRPAARRALRAVTVNVQRAHRAGLRQLTAQPSDPEAETTPGPDSVVAVLSLEQSSVGRLSGMFDRLARPRIVQRLNRAMSTTLTVRDRLLTTVIGLDPEGAGADYADGMADTVDGYADEVASVTEALATDRLTSAARKALTRALLRAKAAQAKVSTAFGGGE